MQTIDSDSQAPLVRWMSLMGYLGRLLHWVYLVTKLKSTCLYTLQMEDQELQSTLAEKCKEIDVFTLCLRVTLPVMRASARCPGDGFTPLRQGTPLHDSQVRRKTNIWMLWSGFIPQRTGLASWPDGWLTAYPPDSGLSGGWQQICFRTQNNLNQRGRWALSRVPLSDIQQLVLLKKRSRGS